MEYFPPSKMGASAPPLHLKGALQPSTSCCFSEVLPLVYSPSGCSTASKCRKEDSHIFEWSSDFPTSRSCCILGAARALADTSSLQEFTLLSMAILGSVIPGLWCAFGSNQKEI